MKKNNVALMVSALLLFNSVMVFGNDSESISVASEESYSVVSEVSEAENATIYNFSDSAFDNLTFEEYEEIGEGLTLYSLSSSLKKMYINNSAKKVNGKAYTRYLSLAGGTVFDEEDEGLRDRCIGIWVPGGSDIYITGRSGSSDIRTLEIKGSTQGTIDFTNNPETKVVSAEAGELVQLLIGAEKNIGIYEITVVDRSDDSSYDIHKAWTFDDVVYDTFIEELTETQVVDDLTFLPGVKVAVSEQILDDITYNRYLSLPRAGTQESSEVYFEVPESYDEVEITLVAMSGGTSERTLQLIDKYGLVVGEMTVDGTIKEQTFTYTGPTNDVYLRSAGSGIRVYSIAVDSNF